MNPRVFSKASWVGCHDLDNPPLGKVDARLLGSIIRDKLGAWLLSIWDAQLDPKARFSIVGKPVD